MDLIRFMLFSCSKYVDLQVCNLSDVPLVNAVLFAKIRLLEGGTFDDCTERVEVVRNSCSWSHRSNFCCRITSDPTSGILERCLCRISIRKEQKGGKSFLKLGFVDINLSEFAGSGVEGMTRSYLLDGYGLHQRQDNSKVQIKITMTHQSADPFFRVPFIGGADTIEDSSLNPYLKASDVEEDEDEDVAGSFVKLRAQTNNDAPECSSMAGSCSVADECASMSSDNRRNAPSALRRLSQDRSSAPRIQSTRIDAGGVIDRMLAETRWPARGEASASEEGLALYVDQDGAASIDPQGAGFQKVTLADTSS
nr:Oestrogen-responsive protein Fam102A B domain containing protein [Haemonchus contortus]